jgi:hypothetical protein
MHPLVRAAAAAAVLAAIGALGRTPPPPAPVTQPTPNPAAPGVRARCGPGTLPEGDVCIPLPRPGARIGPAEPAELEAAPALRSERARELIPRRPDRPADPTAYRYPLVLHPGPLPLLAGLDLPPPTPPVQDRPGSSASTAAAVELGASADDEVQALELDHQEGPAEVAFVGDLLGTTVITAHLVRDGGRLRQLLVVLGNLDRPGPRAVVGAPVEPGDVLGYAGDSAKPGRVALWLEVRQLREGTSLGPAIQDRLVDDAISVPCDPRNVLPLVRPEAPAP